MATTNRASTIITATTITLFAGFLAYAVYFDYKRRSDSAFRKRIRSQKKKVEKHSAEQKAEEDSFGLGEDITPSLTAVVQRIRQEPLPETLPEREELFQMLLKKAEDLLMMGPPAFFEAALCFYRALRVYPSPMELMMIYQQSVPEPIQKLVVDMYNLDIQSRIRGYYDHFPPKSMNVAVEQVEATESLGKRTRKQVLVATRDFKAGEEIYIDTPVVTALDPDIQAKGTHCSHCLRQVLKGMAIKQPDGPLQAVYCSKKCQIQARIQSEIFLFTSEPPMPVELSTEELTEEAKEIRRKAQIAFVNYLKMSKKSAPLLVARFTALNVAIETMRLLPPGSVQRHAMPEGSLDAEYGFYDHMERLRYLELKTPEGEWKLLRGLLQATVPGLDQSHTDERHAMFKGKLAYNGIGICYGGGRDNRPAPTDRPEDVERTRTPYGTARQIGCGLYFVSSYLGHSCAPSVRPSFSNGTSELHLIAIGDIAKGDHLTMAYVDVTQHKDETPTQARRRRRYELAQGWRFACQCPKCISEEQSAEEDESLSGFLQDAQYEAVMARLLQEGL